VEEELSVTSHRSGPQPAAAGASHGRPHETAEVSIPRRFEECVAEGPDRVAVKSPRWTLTYDALNRAANRVSHALLAAPGGTGHPVALLLESDAPMIGAMLGVLKVGDSTSRWTRWRPRHGWPPSSRTPMHP
jgi:non-ribosomal peptide synthetase component F